MEKKKEIHPLKLVLLALFLFTGLKSIALDIKRVQGHSMTPVIRQGQFVLINKLAYGLVLPFTRTYLLRWGSPHTGEIVAARSPLDEKTIIKRVLAARGESFLLTEDHLIIHDRVVPAGSRKLTEILSGDRVPDDKTLLIGDNHFQSIDSRFFGFVSNETIFGKVMGL